MLENQFPILKRKIRGHRLVYLDNAATTQKPVVVLEAMDEYYRKHNANIHRGIHTLSIEATDMYDGARDKVQKFLNAAAREEIVFTGGGTEANNLVVWTWGHENIHRGDEILLTEMEHHSNLVPWQELARKKGAKIKFIPVTPPQLSSPTKGGGISSKSFPPPGGEELPARSAGGKEGGTLDLSNLNRLLTRKTKIVSLVHSSNFLGTVNPIEKIVKAARKVCALTLIDGAQAGAHERIDVRRIGCDFYVLSGHKMYGPTGVGVLYGKKSILESMPPYQTGGHMIEEVDYERATWNVLPWKFEAGTAKIAEVIGLGAAIDFLNKTGLKKIRSYESKITNYALKKLKDIPGIMIYGPQKRVPVIAFTSKAVPAHDLASLLDGRGVAVRTGHHCTMQLHRKLGIQSSARASFVLYNTKADVDALTDAVKFAIAKFHS